MLNKKIGNRLKSLREEKNIKQCVLAKKINYSVPTLSMIENGRKKLTQELATEISKVLQVRCEYLLYKDDYKTDSEKQLALIKKFFNGECDGLDKQLEFYGIGKETSYVNENGEFPDCETKTLKEFIEKTHAKTVTECYFFEYEGSHRYCTCDELRKCKEEILDYIHYKVSKLGHLY